MALLYLFITSKSPQARSSWSNELESRYNNASSVSNWSNGIMAYLEHKHQDISELMHGVVANYRQDDIYTCHIAEYAFGRSPMVDGATTRFHCNTDTRLAWERAANNEFINTVLWCLGSAKMGWVLVTAAVILPVLVKRRRGGYKPQGNFEFGEDMQKILAIVIVD